VRVLQTTARAVCVGDVVRLRGRLTTRKVTDLRRTRVATWFTFLGSGAEPERHRNDEDLDVIVGKP